MNSKKDDTLLIWDHQELKNRNSNVLLWNGFSELENQTSILQFLEDNADLIRSSYLKFIKDFGEMKVVNKKVIDHLIIKDDFSLWWMTLLAEKSFYKSEVPLQCLKLLALNHYLIHNTPSKIELSSSNKLLFRSISSLCSSMDIEVHWINTSILIPKLNRRFFSRKTPHFISALLFLIRYLYRRWKLHKRLKIDWFDSKKAVFMFSYFINYESNGLKEGYFYSRYWNILPKILKESGKKINWMHHFMEGSNQDEAYNNIKYLDKINSEINKNETHNFLESFFSVRMIITTVFLWLIISFRIMSIQNKINNNVHKIRNGWLWPQISNDWKNSVYGQVCIKNIMRMLLLEKAIISLPKQTIGLYLCENQSWERAFIYFWKKYKHGDLIGVAHTVIRYWDLRYHDSIDFHNIKNKVSRPEPDKIALNGPLAFKALQNKDPLFMNYVKVEALRYLYIENALSAVLEKEKLKENSLLILGDYSDRVTKNMLKLVNELDESILKKYNLNFKSHPSYKPNLNDYKNIKISKIDEPLNELLINPGIVLVSGNSAAAIEAVLMNCKTVIITENNDINFSPLRHDKSLTFVRDINELEKSIKDLSFIPKVNKTNRIFWLNSKIPRWKKLFNI